MTLYGAEQLPETTTHKKSKPKSQWELHLIFDPAKKEYSVSIGIYWFFLWIAIFFGWQLLKYLIYLAVY